MHESGIRRNKIRSNLEFTGFWELQERKLQESGIWNLQERNLLESGISRNLEFLGIMNLYRWTPNRPELFVMLRQAVGSQRVL